MPFTQYTHNDRRAILGVDELKKHIDQDIVIINALDRCNYFQRERLLDVVFIAEGEPTPLFLGWNVEEHRIRDTHRVGETGPGGDLLNVAVLDGWIAVCESYSRYSRQIRQTYHFLGDMGVTRYSDHEEAPVPWEHRRSDHYVVSGVDWDKNPSFWTVDRTEDQKRQDEEAAEFEAMMSSYYDA